MESGLEKILSHIKAEADREAAGIKAEADEKAAAIKAEAAEKLNAELQRIERKTQEDVANILERGTSSAELKRKQILLKEKQEIINETVAKAGEKLLALDDARRFTFNVYLYFRIERGLLAHFQKSDIRLVEIVHKRLIGDAYLLDDIHLIRVHGRQAVHGIEHLLVRCRITELAQGGEVFNRFSRFIRVVDTLRLVYNENGTTLRHKFTGSLVHFIAFLIEKIFVLFDRIDVDDHDFKVGGKREITHFVALFGVVNEEVCAFAVILLTEVFFRYLQ